jgi:type IV secretory pathway TraG/TraD family ATPase VirD4
MAQQFRSKQICLGFGFQDKAGLESGGKIGLMSSLINNCSTFFISRIRDEQTRDAIVNIYGTKKDMMPTEQTTIDADGRVIHSGAGSLRVEESYV